MSLTKYLSEAKNRLFLLIFTWLSCFLVGYFYKETLLFVFVQPQMYKDTGTCPSAFYFIFTDVTEIFSVYIKLINFISVQLTLLYILHHLFIFFSPAMYYKEYFYLNLVLKIILLIWCFSIVMLTQILIPLTWKFFLSFQYLTSTKSVNLHFEAKLNEYLIFYISLYYLCVFYCQIFTVFFLFLNYINANIRIIKKFRRLYYFFFLIFATLVSPPDIFSQFLISIIVILLYEVLIFTFLLRAVTRSLIRQPIKTN
jgi:sec-independent protein translocase protein TatC